MLVLLTLFFILLQPGLIIQASAFNSGEYLATEKTSTIDVLIHSAVFFTINKLIETNTLGFGFFNEIEKQIMGT